MHFSNFKKISVNHKIEKILISQKGELNMEKARNSMTDSGGEENLSQFYNENVRNYFKARYLTLVSQTSKSLDNSDSKSLIKYGNNKAELIAADIAIQYLQRKNMLLSLDSASSESRNFLSRKFEDRWVARTLQIHGRHDILHGLIFAKNTNKFDEGFGEDFTKKRKEEIEKKFKSLPRSEKVNISNEPTNYSEIRSKSKSSKSGRNRNATKSNQSQKSRNYEIEEDESINQSSKIQRSESQRYSSNLPNSENASYKDCSSKIQRSGSQQYSSNIANSENASNKDYSSKIKRSESQQYSQKSDYSKIESNEYQNDSDSQIENNNNNNDSINSNILPSPLKTTYSGRGNENEEDIENNEYDEEIKTHTYEYSTIMSEEEATHITEYEYETIEQSSESNDYNSKTNDDTCETGNDNLRNEENQNISNSPNINAYTNTAYEYCSYTANTENENSNIQRRDAKIELQFGQSKDKSSKSGQSNGYYYRRHSKKDKKLVFSNPVEFDNPADDESASNYEKSITASNCEKSESTSNYGKNDNFVNQRNVYIEEDNFDLIKPKPKANENIERKEEHKNTFFIFHAVDIEPDYPLQRIFRSRGKLNKLTPSAIEEMKESLINVQRELNIDQPYEPVHKKANENEVQKPNHNNSLSISDIKTGKENHNISFSELFDNFDASSQNPKEKSKENQKKIKPKVSSKHQEKASNIEKKPDRNKSKTQEKQLNKPLEKASKKVADSNSKRESAPLDKSKKTKNHHRRNGSIKRETQKNDNKHSSNKPIQTKNKKVVNREVQPEREDSSPHLNGNLDYLSSDVSSLVAPPSSSSSHFSLFSSGVEPVEEKVCYKEPQCNQVKKTKFSRKLESAKTESKNKNIKNNFITNTNDACSAASLETVSIDKEISRSSSAAVPLDNLSDSISEVELLEMSDASPASLD